MNEEKILKIHDKDAKRLLTYLNQLLQSMTLNTDGTVSCPVSFMFDARLEVLASKVKAFPNRKDLNRNFVQQALTDVTKQGLKDCSLSQFDAAVKRAVADHLSKPKILHRFLFPLHLTGEWISRKRWLDVLGMRFRRSTWLQIRKFRGWQQFRWDFQDRLELADEKVPTVIDGFTPLVTDVSGTTVGEAFDEANTKFDLLRSLINWVRIKGIISRQFGPPSPLGVSLPPRIYGVFDVNGSYNTMYYTTEAYRYSSKSLPVKTGQNIEKLLKQLQNIPGDVQPLVMGGFLKYVQAMDTADWRTAFLTLWQILEAVARPTADEIKIGDVVNRINNLIGPSAVWKDLLETLESSRHLLVHHGKFSEEGDIEVSFIKMIVEKVLATLLATSRKIPSTQLLKEFYEHISMNDQRLRARKKVITAILTTRS